MKGSILTNFQLEKISVIDLFAGPGGLAEGFSAFQRDSGGKFKICLSVEKEAAAHRTLELRSFFRQFPSGCVPDEYYSYLRGEIARNELFQAYPVEAQVAEREAWRAELGDENLSEDEIDARIKESIGSPQHWVLIGGPPCQAYSTVGRSRNKGIKNYIAEEDKRHFLYREYLRIIAKHWPSIFVMENVKGILSARVNGSRIFDHILEDLHDPLKATALDSKSSCHGYKYKIFSLTNSACYPPDNAENGFSPMDFLIMSEKYGLPQTRHRVILLGVREDLASVTPSKLSPKKTVCTAEVISDLPKLRSGLSREEDTFEMWVNRIFEMAEEPLLSLIFKKKDWDVWDRIGLALQELDNAKEYGRGRQFIPFVPEGCWFGDKWYYDFRLKGICNHTTKAHMSTDLHRYLFAACYAEVHKRSPTIPDFPKGLWPQHKNAHQAYNYRNFQDRFRVQLSSKPATTVMSHIAKDGHYYIHYDPTQCRSLTVREAARLQTFPDNYFFEGPRTQQYIQVGNAVPPLLAHQIAEIVYDLLM